ncbi:N-acetyltransferase [Aliikangiella sp. G2MR2-5]|uniref:GNAT family N-acetyltransferase n=1 Tax=Aliikangiella sp. G2MR2-5 TaxID=2788943 RepID=UPI0018AC8BE4|nr:GNAT family N-acetyltransferase [Aliikangiella sp. G2MR2-5]
MEVTFGTAKQAELNAIVEMLVDDPLGQQREATTNSESATISEPYSVAFSHISEDPNNELIVARTTPNTECPSGVVAVLQLTYIPSLTYQGAWRAQIEGVRVHKSCRGKGLGEKVFRWSISRAKERGCKIVQLTSDKKRPDAIRFYEKLGFVASHEGFKLHF